MLINKNFKMLLLLSSLVQVKAMMSEKGYRRTMKEIPTEAAIKNVKQKINIDESAINALNPGGGSNSIRPAKGTSCVVESLDISEFLSCDNPYPFNKIINIKITAKDSSKLPFGEKKFYYDVMLSNAYSSPWQSIAVEHGLYGEFLDGKLGNFSETQGVIVSANCVPGKVSVTSIINHLLKNGTSVAYIIAGLHGVVPAGTIIRLVPDNYFGYSTGDKYTDITTVTVLTPTDIWETVKRSISNKDSETIMAGVITATLAEEQKAGHMLFMRALTSIKPGVEAPGDGFPWDLVVNYFSERKLRIESFDKASSLSTSELEKVRLIAKAFMKLEQNKEPKEYMAGLLNLIDKLEANKRLLAKKFIRRERKNIVNHEDLREIIDVDKPMLDIASAKDLETLLPILEGYIDGLLRFTHESGGWDHDEIITRTLPGFTKRYCPGFSFDANISFDKLHSSQRKGILYRLKNINVMNLYYYIENRYRVNRICSEFATEKAALKPKIPQHFNKDESSLSVLNKGFMEKLDMDDFVSVDNFCKEVAASEIGYKPESLKASLGKKKFETEKASLKPEISQHFNTKDESSLGILNKGFRKKSGQDSGIYPWLNMPGDKFDKILEEAEASLKPSGTDPELERLKGIIAKLDKLKSNRQIFTDN